MGGKESEQRKKDNGQEKPKKKEGTSTLSGRKLSISSRSTRNSADVELPSFLAQLGYQLHRKIASGGFSDVYIATNTGLPNIELACKVFKLKMLPKEWTEKFLKKEMKLMVKLRHKNICAAYDVYKTRSKGFIFMPFCSGGTLDGYIKKKGKQQEASGKKFFFGIMSGIDYLHSNNIAHRDIKLENVLLDENLEVKLCDFGFAVLANSNQPVPILRETICGTAIYVAPEVLMQKQKYDAKKADIYSVGVCLYEIMHGCKPFDGHGPNALRSKEMLKQKIARDINISKSLTPECCQMIKLLLRPDPNCRPTSTEVLKLHWCKSN